MMRENNRWRNGLLKAYVLVRWKTKWRLGHLGVVPKTKTPKTKTEDPENKDPENEDPEPELNLNGVHSPALQISYGNFAGFLLN